MWLDQQEKDFDGITLKTLKTKLSKQLAEFISDIQYPVDDSYLDVV